ncbi:MAG: OmcA/MtrC family decaheme c-type cytochrome [Steroidobacteraceae bacterium]|nr:OmcA/MtrC family decaheme c-type cytochrome [Steroidobacteraceae bacterium]
MDSDAASRRVTVTFSLTDAAGNPVVGAEAKNFEFQLAKLVAATPNEPAYWQSYINRSEQDTAADTKVLLGGPERAKPTAVSTGVYRYTFCTPLAQVASFKYYGSGTQPTCAAGVSVENAGVLNSPGWAKVEPTLNLAYEPTAPTRLAIIGRDGAFVNIVQDFIPASLPNVLAATVNEVVTNESCGACHAENSADRGQLLIMRTLSQKGTGHLGRRYQVEVCSACHNARGYDSATSTDDEWETLDLKVLVHKLHEEGYPQNAPFGGVSNIGAGFPAGVSGEALGVMNCRSCHDNQSPKILPVQPANRTVADKNAWRTQISQQACNTCHNVDYTAHFGNQPGNVQCGECHSETRSLPVAVAHATPYPTPNNPELYAGAAKVEYDIASVTVNASNQPTVKFRVLVNGSPISLTAPPAGVTISAVNFKLAWSAPQPTPVDVDSGPAVAQPVDWNNLQGPGGAAPGARQYWDFTTNLGTNFRSFDQPTGPTIASILGTLTGGPGVDPDGYYTTAPGIAATPLAFPSNATLRGVAIESYLTINGMNISGNAPLKGIDGTANTLRRQVVDLDSCNTCHERMGFHSNAGRMNNVEYCATCHNTEMSSSNLFEGFATLALAPGGAEFFYRQQPNNFKEMIHSIHAGRERAAQDPSDPFNFIRGNPNASGGSGPMVFQNVVYPAQVTDCETCHKPGTYRLPSSDRYLWTVIDAEPALAASAAVFNPGLSIRQGPATGACGSCHISSTAKAHVQQNSAGGVETCVLCHGPGKSAEAHID